MWLEKNKVIARRFRRELWNTGDVEIADQIIGRDCVIHGRIPFATDFTSGPEALKQLVSFYHMSFSDIEMTVEEIVAEGEMVAVRWSTRARHTGQLFEAQPTGREVQTSGFDLLRIVDGLIVEGWVNWDVLSLLEQVVVGEDSTSSGEVDPMSDFLNLITRLQNALE